MLAPATHTKNRLDTPLYFSVFTILNVPLYGIFSSNYLHHLTFAEKHHIQNLQSYVALQPAPAPLRASWQEQILNRLQNKFPPVSFNDRNGTAFQQSVWQKIQETPYGQTRTYGEIAKILGSNHLSRAVGSACHKNPVALFTPCHRVLGQGNLGGYAGGTHIKKTLLNFEQQRLNSLKQEPMHHDEL